MDNLLRDALIEEILYDANGGDTTVLTEILNNISDEMVFYSLSEKSQNKVKSYYDVHVNIPKNGYSIGVVCNYSMDVQRVIDTAVENELFEEDDDYLYIDSVDNLTQDEWEAQFKR